MKILWISPGFAANENDTSCIPTLQLLALEYKKIGLDLTILSLDYPSQSGFYHWYDIPVFPRTRHKIKIFRWINWFNAYRDGVKLHKEIKFDLIHSFWLGPAWIIGKWISKKFNIPHLTTIMGQDVFKSNKYKLFTKNKDLQNLIFVSENQSNEFLKTFNHHPRYIIEWGLNLQEIIVGAYQERTIDIIGCGSLIGLKNWILWIDIVSSIIEQNTNIKAILIGSGPEKIKLSEYIRFKGKLNQIKILDVMPRKEVLWKMKQSKVFLHTSTFESYGFVLVEAYSMGCRVVSTPVGVANKYGLVSSQKMQLIKFVMDSLKGIHFNPIADIPNINHTALKYRELYKERIEIFDKEKKREEA